MHVLMVFMYHPVEKAGIWSGKGRLCYTIHPNSCSTRRSPDMPARLRQQWLYIKLNK